MGNLILAAVLWLGLHIGVAGSALRGVLAGRLGEQGFRGLFSAASIAAFGFLVYAYLHAPRSTLWYAPRELRWLLAALMLPALYLLLASFATVSLKPEDAGTRRDAARGILRVTRHPMLWSFALWAVVHIAGNGELAACVFFGTFLLTALAGMPSIDAKAARRKPQAWAGFAAATSILPFGAILARRNRFSAAEIGWLLPLLALLLWAALLLLHRKVFGAAPLPGLSF
jgi:uncharacterized membrane protein